MTNLEMFLFFNYSEIQPTLLWGSVETCSYFSVLNISLTREVILNFLLLDLHYTEQIEFKDILIIGLNFIMEDYQDYEFIAGLEMNLEWF